MTNVPRNGHTLVTRPHHHNKDQSLLLGAQAMSH